MINIKNSKEIELMVKGGKILSQILNILIKKSKPGIQLIELDKIAEEYIISHGAEISFKKVPGFKWTICACVNDVVVHGIPNSYRIKKGDVVGIDCGVYYSGFHTDSAWTIAVENNEEKIDNFLDTGKKALKLAIKQVKQGNYIFDISKTIQDTVENAGYSVVRTLVGHGVGRSLHEEPEVPGFVSKQRELTTKLIPGMVIAIEVIYNMGGPEVIYKGNDGWTIGTKDGRISGLFEATVAVTSHGCLVLT